MGTAFTRVHRAAKWTAVVQSRDLGRNHIRSLLLEVFQSHVGLVLDPVKNSVNWVWLYYSLEISAPFAHQSEAGKLAKLLGCVIMCISEYNEGGFKEGAGKVGAVCIICLMSTD